MRINVAVPEAHVTAPVLDAALESVTRLNEHMLDAGEVPTFDKALHYGVRWKPEPPGQEHFDHAHEVISRKWGDCDDLAPWHAASLRHTGADPGARAIAKRSGPNRWHAVVQRSDGTIDDPSRRAGMGQHPGVIGAALPLMYPPQSVVGGSYVVHPQIALRPARRGGYEARADVPWYWADDKSTKLTATDYAMTALHTAPIASAALTGAIDGAIDLAEAAGYAAPRDLERLACISDLCAGATVQDLRKLYSPQDVQAAVNVIGSFWSSLKRVASPVANLARQAVPFIPGVGPLAAKGLDLAEQAMHPGAAAAEAPAVAPPAFQPNQPARGFVVRFF